MEAVESKFFMLRSDPPFAPHRVPCSAAAHKLVAEVINQLQNYESLFGIRRRARKVKDQSTFEQTVTAIIADLAYRHSINPEQKIAISLSKGTIGRKNRYTPKVMGKTLPDILQCLSSPELSFVEIDKGHYFKSLQTTIRAGQHLITLILEHNLNHTDFDEGGTSELVLLRKEHEGGKKGKWQEYDDTPDTLKYRKEMEHINEWLARADFNFDKSLCWPRAPVDSHNRTLRRIFNNSSFVQGGRLYGGFWQSLTKEERQKGIRIAQQPTVCLDYSQACPRILYGIAGVTPPGEDIYAIPEMLDYRDGVKKLFNALLCSTKPLTRCPQNTRKILPEKTHALHMFKWIAQAHPAIESYFGTGIGLELMFHESQILVDVLISLIKTGIVALPIHDAVIVSVHDMPIAQGVMERVFKEHTGIDGIVRTES